MTYQNNKIFIPVWISYRTFFFGCENSRTYISNEKDHCHVLLEGLASDMWEMLSSGVSGTEFDKWAEEKGVAGEVDWFLQQLEDQGLIVRNTSGIENTEFTYSEIAENAEGADGDEEAEFIEEMQNWFYKNNLMYSLFFELTYLCNLRCVHCYNPKNISNIGIDFEQCKKAIDDAYSVGCFRVTFSGGESTLHGKFLELVKYARKKRMSVEIFTNGQILSNDDKLYRELLAQYPYRICLSLYSTDEKTHERVTAVRGSFKRTYDLIKRLRSDNVNVQIKNFLLNVNCADCIKVKEFAKGINAMAIADISLIPTIEGDKKTLQYMLDEDDLFRLYTDAASPLYIGANFKRREYGSVKDSSPCLGGFTGLTITPKGEVVICVSLPLSVGNINHTSLKEIWLGGVEKREGSKLNSWRKTKIRDFKECFKNDYCAFCDFCPGMGFLENGYLTKSEVLCMQAKTKMRAFEYLAKKAGRS